MSEFRKSFQVGWGDLDFNAHMKNTSYLDVSGTTRMSYFAEHGFSMRELERLRFGPVILRDELDYHRELRLLETYEVTVASLGLSPDGSRFRILNEFFRAADGKRAARVVSHGGWLSLDQRKIVPPPEELRRLLEEMPKGEGYESEWRVASRE